MVTPNANSITDFAQFSALRSGASENDPDVLREVAGQFEALFLQTMLKNMREASLGDPLLGDSDQHEMYQGMLDQQLSAEMASGKGIGLADLLVRQLGGESNTQVVNNTSLPIERMANANWTSPEAFAKDIWPHARRAAREIGVKPEVIVAQAALETGWGKHVMPDQGGGNSYNLFGIKSSSSWRGAEVARDTLEFADGIPQRRRESFRAYTGVAESLADYTRLLTENPRYEGVRGHGDDSAGFARALQNSGYATDPEYATKITDVLASPTMQRALSAIGLRDDNA